MDNNLVNDLSRILEGLDSSQEQLEKDAFDVINSSDTSLNLVRDSISSVEEILGMIAELNEIAEESAAKIRELEKLSKDIEQFAGVISSSIPFVISESKLSIPKLWDPLIGKTTGNPSS